MPSTMETILNALAAVLDAGTSAEVLRNADMPEEVGAGGLIVIRDGEPGEPEVTMSPLTWHYDHQVEAEVFAVASGALTRDAAFDVLRVAIGTALAADRTLGGLAEWVEPMPPSPDDLPFAGGPSVKAGLILITVSYAVTDPLAA